MGRESGRRRAADIEIYWRQSRTDEWVALLREPRTARQWEVRSAAELEGVLQSVLADGRRPAAAPHRRRTAAIGFLGGESESASSGQGRPQRDGSDGSAG